MRASILDLRRRMGEVLRALDHNESVKILYRGRERAVLVPAAMSDKQRRSVREHSAFGMWKDRKDLGDVAAFVRRLRKSRFSAV